MSKRIKPNKISLDGAADTSVKSMLQVQAPSEEHAVLKPSKPVQDKLEQYDELEKHMKELSTEKDNLERRLEEYIVSNRRLESELSDLTSQLLECKVRNTEMVREIEALKKELSNMKSGARPSESGTGNISARGGSSSEPVKFQEIRADCPVEVEHRNMYSESGAASPRRPYVFGGPTKTRDGYSSWN